MNEKKIEPTDTMVEAGASSAWEEANPGILGWNSISERHKEGCRRDARAHVPRHPHGSRQPPVSPAWQRPHGGRPVTTAG